MTPVAGWALRNVKVKSAPRSKNGRSRAMSGPRYQETDSGTVCLDCGVVVAITAAHTRFHSILSGHAWSLAVLKTSHVTSGVHDRYDVSQRIDSKRFDSWSTDALAEVIAAHQDQA